MADLLKVTDLEEISYPEEVIALLYRNLMSNNFKSVFSKVFNAKTNGLTHDMISDYKDKKRLYDKAFACLLFASLIENRPHGIGNKNMYFVTKRGLQLGKYIAERQLQLGKSAAERQGDNNGK